jgi:cyclic-di-GMP-binding biofilm dispersal mediator protein
MHEGGRIIVIGSVNGDRMPFVGAAAYALSKSALQGMARGLARDFGDRGITVNIVQPVPYVITFESVEPALIAATI